MASPPDPPRSSRHEPVSRHEPAQGAAAGERPDGREVTSPALPKAAVGRLSLYFRELHRVLDSGRTSINSRDLGRLVDVSPAVVRRDLSNLGTIGRRGVGYSVPVLLDNLGKVLGASVPWGVVLIGVGSLGNALLRYRGFARLGFRLIAAFDVNPAVIGRNIGEVVIQPLDQLESAVRATPPELAILAVPAEQAQDVVARLAAAGIRGILNFAPTTIRAGATTAVVNVDLASELQRLVFSVRQLPTPPPR